MSAAPADIGWLLTLEPVGSQLGWSLLRADATGTRLVDAGWRDDTSKLRLLADSVRPDVAAAPSDDGYLGVWASGLADPARESRAAIGLGMALLPAALRDALLAADPDAPHTVTIAQRGWLSAVAWDALSLTARGDVRLVERAVVVGGLSPALAVGRARVAPRRDPASPGVAVVDPGPVLDRGQQLYPHGYPELLTGPDGLDPADVCTPQTRGTSPEEFAYLLHQQPSRLLYVGHVRAAPDTAPAAAALMLSVRGRPQPLTARQWLAEPHRWPSPHRVALIGCASNDTRAREQSGLVVAAIGSGAQLVTSTRWPLPTDYQAPSPLTPTCPTYHQGLTKLALAVHHAHRARRPLERLRDWQLDQLHRWRVTHLLEYSPLLWSSLVSHLAPGPAEPLPPGDPAGADEDRAEDEAGADGD